jgi:Flp pilus assembly protein TadG
MPDPAAKRFLRADRRLVVTHRGAVAIELLLSLPVWLIGLLAIIEFGSLFSNLQHVALASRVGADVAARTSSLPESGSIPSAILDAVNDQLAAANITPSEIVLEHNLGGSYVMLVQGQSAFSGPSQQTLPAVGTYVRVTVCAPAMQLAPNILRSFGLDIQGWDVGESTTFQYSLD